MVTLASLVEKETARPEERPLVAAVYRNRLKVGMGMQADPTVIYALQQAGQLRRQPVAATTCSSTRRTTPTAIRACRRGRSPRRAWRRSRRVASGRPPVAHLYFVSRNDGSHVFADTLAEHNRNVQEWQVRYFRERRNH